MKSVLVLVVLAACCSMSVRAAPCGGRVVDEGNTGPVGGATVLIVPFDDSLPSRAVVTQARGEWRCPDDLRPGRYMIQAQAPGGSAAALFYDLTVTAGGAAREALGGSAESLNFKVSTAAPPPTARPAPEAPEPAPAPPPPPPPASPERREPAREPSAAPTCFDTTTVELAIRPRKLSGDAWDGGLFNFILPDPKIILTPIPSKDYPCSSASAEFQPIFLPSETGGGCRIDKHHGDGGVFCRDTLRVRFEGVRIPRVPLHVFVMDVDIAAHDLIFEHRAELNGSRFAMLETTEHRGSAEACYYSGPPFTCNLTVRGETMARICIGGCEPQPRNPLCDLSNALSRIGDEKLREQTKDLFVRMVGALADMSKYRDQFLNTSWKEGLGLDNTIDMFPAAYYNTTHAELERIAAGDFTFPDVKLRQMIAFYDAYKVNREAWDRGDKGSVEDHWKRHFETATRPVGVFEATARLSATDNKLQRTIDSGMQAHIIFDFPRALDYAYRNGGNRVSWTQAQPDFQATEQTFNTSIERTMNDMASRYPIFSGLSNFADVVFVKPAELLSGVEIGNATARSMDYIKLLRNSAWRSAARGDLRPLAPQSVADPVQMRDLGVKLCQESR